MRRWRKKKRYRRGERDRIGDMRKRTNGEQKTAIKKDEPKKIENATNGGNELGEAERKAEVKRKWETHE